MLITDMTRNVTRGTVIQRIRVGRATAVKTEFSRNRTPAPHSGEARGLYTSSVQIVYSLLYRVLNTIFWMRGHGGWVLI